MAFQSPDNNNLETDLNWIYRLASTLAGAGRGAALQALAELLVARCILADNPLLTESREEALAEEFKRKTRQL